MGGGGFNFYNTESVANSLPVKLLSIDGSGNLVTTGELSIGKTHIHATNVGGLRVNKTTVGIGDNGCVMSAIANSNYNENAQAGVLGYTPGLSALSYGDIDSVASYAENTGRAPVFVISGAKFSAAKLTLATGQTFTSAQKAQLFNGAILLTDHTPPWQGFVSSYTNNTINVIDGWGVFNGGGSQAFGLFPPATLADGSAPQVAVSPLTKVWGNNTNVFIGVSGNGKFDAQKACGFELGIINSTNFDHTWLGEYDPNNRYSWGYDAINFGNKRASSAHMARGKWDVAFHARSGDKAAFLVDDVNGSIPGVGFLSTQKIGSPFTHRPNNTDTAFFLGNGGSIEMGLNNTANTPYIDFHSSGNPNDFDARIIATGGNNTVGKGNLDITAGALRLGYTPIKFGDVSSLAKITCDVQGNLILTGTKILNGNGNVLWDNQTTINTVHTKTVYIGGVGARFKTLADPANCKKMLAAGNIGLYMHGNGIAALSPEERTALWATWGNTGVTPTGQGQALGEVGGFDGGPVDAQYRSYFGGSYPNEVNMNIITGNGNGSGTYTAVSGEAHPGTVYTGYVTSNDLVIMKGAIDAAIAAGTKNIAIYLSPNGGGENIADPFETSAFWANARTAALYGGAIALDVPPGYWVARGIEYENFITQMILWGKKVGIRTNVTVSPYAIVPDSHGNINGAGYDPDFLSKTQRLVAVLRAANALPSQWTVENYDLQGTMNDIQTDDTTGSLNEIALYLAQTVPAQVQGTTAPVAAGGAPDNTLMTTTTASAVDATLSKLSSLLPLKLCDIGGAGSLASQESGNVSISGGTITGNTSITTSATPLFLQGAIIQGTGGAFVLDANTANQLGIYRPGGGAADFYSASIGAGLKRPNVIATTNLDVSGLIASHGNASFEQDITVAGQLLSKGALVVQGAGTSVVFDANTTNTLNICKPGGIPLNLVVGTIGAGGTSRPTLIATVDLDASGAIALSGVAMSIHNLPTSDPHIVDRVWKDTNGFLRISSG